jgi:magnesium transporter
MLLDLKFSVGTLGLAMGTFLAGLYGMNLENFIEETNWGFAGVTGMSVFFSLLVCWYGLTKLRKVQRVKMAGYPGSQPPPAAAAAVMRRIIAAGGNASGAAPRSSPADLAGWYGVDGPVGLLEAKNRERLRRINLQKQSNVKSKRWWNF